MKTDGIWFSKTFPALKCCYDVADFDTTIC